MTHRHPFAALVWFPVFALAFIALLIVGDF